MGLISGHITPLVTTSLRDGHTHIRCRQDQFIETRRAAYRPEKTDLMLKPT